MKLGPGNHQEGRLPFDLYNIMSRSHRSSGCILYVFLYKNERNLEEYMYVSESLKVFKKYCPVLYQPSIKKGVEFYLKPYT